MNETVEVMESVTIPDKVDLTKVSVSKQLAFRDQKIRDHYKGDTLTELINSDDLSVEDLMRALLSEILREADNLAGNRVIADENGNIESSTVISAKRVEIVEKALKAIMSKKEFEAQNSIDVESPSMKIVFRYFLEKCQESFDKAGMSADISDTFFRCFNDVSTLWKKELKKRIAEIKT